MSRERSAVKEAESLEEEWNEKAQTRTRAEEELQSVKEQLEAACQEEERALELARSEEVALEREVRTGDERLAGLLILRHAHKRKRACFSTRSWRMKRPSFSARWRR